MSSLLLSWHHCPCCNGVAAIDVQASLQSRRLCCCHDNIVALVAMALLLSSSWCCCPCHDRVVAIIDAQVSLMLSQWPCRPFALAPLPTFHGHCPPCCIGVIIPIVLTFLPSRYMGVVTIVAPALLPLLSWCVCAVHCCCCTCHASVVILHALALATLSCRPLCPCCVCILQSICMHLCPR
jgi:hypothetical protein